MKITFAMLCYVMQRDCKLKDMHMGAGEIVLKEDIWNSIRLVGPAAKMQDHNETGESLGYVFCGAEPSEHDLRKLSTQDSWAVLEGRAEVGEVRDYLHELVIRILHWDARFDAAILHRENPEEIMSWGREFLFGGYALIDRDFFYLYATEDYMQPADPVTLRAPKDVIDALLLDPCFHTAASERDIFYYRSTEINRFSLCGNIFRNQQDYYARIVMSVGKTNVPISSGAEQFFAVFVKHVEDMISYGNAFAVGHSRDALRQMFRAMLDGENWETDTQSEILQTVGWKMQDTYMTVCYRFYEEEGWSTQLETTLPYLVWELEQEWPESYAFFKEGMVISIWNISRSAKDQDSDTFHQQIASFLRDHVCRAGISPQFEGISLLPYAVKAAREALRLGQNRNPETWSYSFDDYRLDYMMEKVREELPFSLLCHPAIRKLETWDREQGTEYARTLEAYLNSHLNMTTAAEQLFIHRTTFCRRMDHIRELTGLDIKDPREILLLMLSYGMLRV